jgi:hypothetical protein
MMKALNLVVCPGEIIALDAHAETLWPVLLKKIGVTISQGAHIEDKRAWVLRNFGVDDLVNRLDIQQKREHGGPQDHIARAKIWRHVAEACLPGDSISDLTASNMYLLNAFIVPRDQRFATPFDALRVEKVQQLPLCANQGCPNGPAQVPSNRAKFCTKSCRNMVSKQRQWSVEPPQAIHRRRKRSDAAYETPAERQKAYRNRSKFCVTDNEALEAA